MALTYTRNDVSSARKKKRMRASASRTVRHERTKGTGRYKYLYIDTYIYTYSGSYGDDDHERWWNKKNNIIAPAVLSKRQIHKSNGGSSPVDGHKKRRVAATDPRPSARLDPCFGAFDSGPASVA